MSLSPVDSLIDEVIPTGDDDGHVTDLSEFDELEKLLEDPWWRICNLYYITDKNGEVVQFKPNWAQKKFYQDRWYRNVILKARQLGFSTMILIMILDQLVFRPNTSAGLIAHALDDASKLFRNKIMFPYNHLPSEIRQMVSVVSETKTELSLSNGSMIGVGTSMRGGTLQHLHVSEFGKIAAAFPDKAREIKTGAFNAVAAGNFIYVESTAEGSEGEFYSLCKKAEIATTNASARQIPLSDKQFFHHFFPWWKNPEYRADPTHVIHPDRLIKYYNELRTKYRIPLTDYQMAWYTLMEDDQGEDMKREYPSTAKEAFESSVFGNYYGDEMLKARSEGRISVVPHNDSMLVDTFWDIGVSDYTAIWFAQTVGREHRFIRFFQDEGKGLRFYLDLLTKLREEEGYRYGRHFAPHDILVREFGNDAKTRLESAADHGYQFEVVPQHPLSEGINATRNIIGSCVFDAEGCADGIKCLENYRKKWDKGGGVWKNTPLHNIYSHGADAFRIFATGYKPASMFKRGYQQIERGSDEGWT